LGRHRRDVPGSARSQAAYSAIAAATSSGDGRLSLGIASRAASSADSA
jgi:hypothetical protein